MSQDIDTGLRCLVMKLKLLSVPFSIENLKHQVGKPEKLNSDDLLFLIKDHLGLKAKRKAIKAGKIPKQPLPLIAEIENGEFALILQSDGQRILFQRGRDDKPEEMDIKRFETEYSGRVILITDNPSEEYIDNIKDFGMFWFIKAFFKYGFTSSQIIIASVLLQIFILVTPLFTMVIIDKVLSSGSRDTLDVLVLAVALITIFDFIVGQTRSHLLNHASNKVDLYAVAKLFSHLLSLPLAFFTGREIGDTISRIKEIESIRAFITGAGLTTVIDFPFSLILIGVMFYFSPILALVVLGAVILSILVYVVVGPIMKKRMQQQQEDSTDTQSYLYETVASIETIKSLSAEKHMEKAWEKELVKHSKNAQGTEKLNNRLNAIAGFINKITVAGTLYLGSIFVIGDENGPSMTPGQLIAFNMLVGRVMGPAQRIAQIFQQIEQVNVSAGRIKEIFDTPPEPALHSNLVSLPELKGHIQFENVSFKFDQDSPAVLEEVHLEVKPGEIVGVVGKSGSGKSTMMKLLERLYIPSEGRIFIDGINIAEINPAWFRKNIGVVLQDNILLNRSIRENIALSNPGLTMEQIEAASVLSGADEFIRKMPKVYDTVVGERGTMLSAGQRQRIAIARALVTDPKILILDEATSALDYESEQVIQENMNKICKGRTVFIVAHRFSTLRIAKRILSIEEGRIVEDGAIADLLKKKGLFYHLYELQHLSHNKISKPANPAKEA